MLVLLLAGGDGLERTDLGEWGTELRAGAPSVPDLLLAQPAVPFQTAVSASSCLFWCLTSVDLHKHSLLQSHLLQLARPVGCVCVCVEGCVFLTPQLPFRCLKSFLFSAQLSLSAQVVSFREPAAPGPGTAPAGNSSWLCLLLPGSFPAHGVSPTARSHRCGDPGASRRDEEPCLS